MANRNSLLGRSRPADRLSKADREALERAAAEPAPAQAPAPKPIPTKPAPAKAAPAGNNAPPANVGKDGSVRQDQLKFRWIAECPACGFKVAGDGNPQPGQRLARCGRCKLNIYLKGK